jgi:hypothetical protein
LRLFENRVLKRVFEVWRNEVTGSWKKIHGVELHNLYTSKNIIRMIQIRRGSRWARHVEHGGGEKCIQNCGWKA